MLHIYRHHKKTVLLTAVIILALVAGSLSFQINFIAQSKDDIHSNLQSVLNSTQIALHNWSGSHKQTVNYWANSEQLKQLTLNLVTQRDTESLTEFPSIMDQLNNLLTAAVSQGDFQEFLIIDAENTILAASNENNIGKQTELQKRPDLIKDIWQGKSIISTPVIASTLVSKSKQDIGPVPTMYAASPIYDNNKRVIAALLFRVNPLKNFTTIIQMGLIDYSGETYAFDNNGVMISNSRFTDYLHKNGLLDLQNTSMLNISIRLPFNTNIQTEEKQPALTMMAQFALAGASGFDMEGYEDYRGITVVGLWYWDSELGFGIATEQDKSEAFESIYPTLYTVSFLTVLTIFLILGLLITYIINQARKSANAQSLAILASIPDAFISINQEGQIVHMNNNTRQLFGYSREELMGQQHDILVPDRYRSTHSDYWKSFFKNPVERNMNSGLQVLGRHKNGHEIPLQIGLSAYTYLKKNYVLSVIHDISEHKKAQELLAFTRKVLVEAQRIAHLGSWEMKIPSGEMTWSDETFRIFGLQPQTINPSLDFALNRIHPDDQQQVTQTYEQLLESGKDFKINFRILWPNQTVRHALSQGELIRDEQNKSIQIIGSILDITDQKSIEDKLAKSRHELEIRVEERTRELADANRELKKEVSERRQAECALKESEQRFRAIFEQAAVGVAMLDTQNNQFLKLNRKFADILGYDINDLMQQTLCTISHKSDTSSDKQYMQNLVEGKIREYSLQKRYIHKSGKEVWVNQTVSPLWALNETPNIHVIIIQDITEQKQIQEETKQHQLELAHLDRLTLMGEMATSIAHELNQPLTAIATYADVALRIVETGADKPKQLMDCLTGARNQSTRAGEIIRHLRKLVSKQAPETSTANINHLIEQVINFAKAEAINQHVKIVLELGNDLPMVSIDEIQIEQVLLNLIGNAMDAMRLADTPGKKIVIFTCLNTENKVQVEVRDNGPGIDEKTLDKIFDRFLSTKQNTGMGMGLPICRTILESHGEKLWATSVPGQGATFYFTLPKV